MTAYLNIEDFTIQSMEDVSPIKWHLGHTTWFFEELILCKFQKKFVRFQEKYNFIFNSYYESLGARIQRNHRGSLNRPLLKEVLAYRIYITEQMISLLETTDNQEFIEMVQIGIAHEEQHQELIYTDIKHIFFSNPLKPSFLNPNSQKKNIKLYNSYNVHEYSKSTIQETKEHTTSIGSLNSTHFCYDHETPSHQVYLYPFEIDTSLITNQEYLEFILDGGYKNFNLWFADAWELIQKKSWQHPLYWFQEDGEWFQFTLYGVEKLALNEPVCHVNFYEASAYAKWKNKRLPTEFEWESVAKKYPKELENAYLLNSNEFHPNSSTNSYNFIGNVWEWTSSHYEEYPRFKPYKYALSEYNGKFMNNQYVLRGGSCVTPNHHIRFTYRNFFQADKSWQFSGIRLCKDIQ